MTELQPIYHPGSPAETEGDWAEQYAAAFDGPALRAQLVDAIFDGLNLPRDWGVDERGCLYRGLRARLFDHLDGFEVVQLAAEYDLCLTFARWCARDRGDE